MYQFALWVHLGTLAVTLAGVVLADHYALSWLRGTHKTLSKERLVLFHRWVGTGIILMVASGGYMLSGQWEYLLREPLFLLKIVFVLILIANSFVIGRVSHIAAVRPFQELSRKEKTKLFVSGAASAISWVCAGTVAVLFFG